MESTLEKISSKMNGKKQVGDTGFINFVNNGEDMGRSNYREGKGASLRQGHRASELIAKGDFKSGQKAIVEGAKGAGVAKQTLKNRSVFQDKKYSNSIINANEADAKQKKIGWGKGKKADEFASKIAKSKSAKLPSGTIRPNGNKAPKSSSLGAKAGNAAKNLLKKFR